MREPTGEDQVTANAQASDESSGGPRDDRYLRGMLLLLVSATFFEGYDGSILALILSDIQETFSVTESQLGVSRALIELGLGFAFFLTRLGDRVGRRKLLLWSVAGYTLMTALTAFSWDLWSFTAFQSLSRVFLGAEYAVAVTMVVEEFPAHRRAGALGRLLMCAAAGAVAVALLLLLGVGEGPLGWRTLYLVGLVPLLFLAVLRRKVRETRRFEELQAEVRTGRRPPQVSFWEPWRREYRAKLVLVGVVNLLRSLPLFGATAWFFYYAEREQGVDSQFLQIVFIIAYTCGIAGYVVCGHLMDRVGRRPTAVGFCLMAVVSSVLLFQVGDPIAIGVLLVVAVFFGLGMAPVLGAMSTELFPTYIRNQSAAWARNVFEIAGFILGPLLVGVLGDHYTGVLGSVGDATSFLALLFIPCAWLLYRHLPETRALELEQITSDSTASAWSVRRRGPVVAAAVLVLVTAATALGVVELGRITRRPEGAAERFLQAVSSGDEEDVRRYGSRRIAGFGSPPAGEDSVFSSIEVGASEDAQDGSAVPFRVGRHDEKPLTGELAVRKTQAGEWRVVALAPGPVTGRVPSQGGPSAAESPLMQWVAAVAAACVLTALLEVLQRRLSRTSGEAIPPRGPLAAAETPERSG
ncbi:MAG TPA: MFS transporter [Actinomycetota bacterium]|nr:MFS transporter [Actinomycetota bacterium]